MKLKSLLSATTAGIVVAAPNPLAMEEHNEAYAECMKHRAAIAQRYDEANGFAFPGRAGMTQAADANEAYDDTAIQAAPEFASRIQAGVVPNYGNWASHIAGMMVEDEDEKLETNKQLQMVDEFVFEMINSSNFQVEVNECFMDLAVGTMGMEIVEQDETNPILCHAIPLNQLSFDIGPDGRPDPICRTRRMRLRDIPVVHRGARNLEDLAAGEYAVVEIWQRDWSETAAHRYRCTVFLPEKDARVLLQYEVQGVGSRKMEVARWSKSSGEVWGRGPLFNCLPSMRICNFAMKALIDHADIAIAGIWSAEDDGVLNTDTVKLEPGVLVPRAPGSAPLTNVAPTANFDIQQFLVSEHRENIKKALFTEQLGNPNKTPMSATEVDQRMAELARAIGAPFGRIVLEFAFPFVARCIRILKDRNLIKLPEVDGKEIKRIPTSPLAQGQRFDDIDRTTKFVGTVGQLFGPETAALTVDATETSIYLGERFGVPNKIVRSRAAQKALAENIAKAQAGGMGGDGGGTEGPGAPPPA